MKIGIAIIAYNRPECAYICAQTLLNSLEHNHNYQIICCIDDEKIESFIPIKNLNISLIYHKNFGISINKSIAMYYLRNCDHIFLLEEDIEFIKPGWINLYLNVHQLKKVGIIDIIPQHIIEKKENIFKTENLINNIQLLYCNVHTAQIMSITKNTFKTIGYFNPIFKKYGYEHCEYTDRCKIAKLYPNNLFFIMSNIYDYVRFQDCGNSLTTSDVNKYIQYNGPIYSKELKKLKYYKNVFIGEKDIYLYLKNTKIYI